MEKGGRHANTVGRTRDRVGRGVSSSGLVAETVYVWTSVSKDGERSAGANGSRYALP